MLYDKMTFKPVSRLASIRTGKEKETVFPPPRGTSTLLSFADRIGGLLVRWGHGRNRYRVESGLYFIGNPERTSPVLVTANYKLTFDSVRKELAGLDLWILVLDTHGVNVWCAAGKGTFGTGELVRRIRITGLSRLVEHRELILPQLGAPGVAAHTVKKESGFSVRYGPVYARDIPGYLATGKIKSAKMKEVRFGLFDRLAVAPVEIAHAWPLVLVSLGLSALLALPFPSGNPERLQFALLSLTGGIFAGTMLFPALLPLLPTRAFSLKGAFLGLAWNAATAVIVYGPLTAAVIPALLPAVLLSIPLVTYLSLNFTGASTFTCQKGTEIEVRRSLVPMAVSAIAGAVLGLVNYLRVV